MLSTCDWKSTVSEKYPSWEQLAAKLFETGPVGIFEEHEDGSTSIYARVTGYTEDPVYGRLLRVQRVDRTGTPVVKTAPSEKGAPLETDTPSPEMLAG